MYDNNPTLQLPVKTMVEGDQGKVFGDENFTREEGRKYFYICLLYTSPSPRDRTRSRMPSSA